MCVLLLNFLKYFLYLPMERDDHCLLTPKLLIMRCCRSGEVVMLHEQIYRLRVYPIMSDIVGSCQVLYTRLTWGKRDCFYFIFICNAVENL